MPIAYCGGTFDLLHPGHVRMLRWAKETFGTTVVAVNTDEFVTRYKAKPAQTLHERMEMLESCRYVDSVTVNWGDENSRIGILAANATHVVNGSDWTRERLMEQMNLDEKFLKAHGLEIALCPLERIFSTTELKDRIWRGHGNTALHARREVS